MIADSVLVSLLIAQVSLSEFSKRFEQAPLVLVTKQALPAQAAGLKRISQGYYGTPILSALFGKRTSAYLKCGAAEAAVGNYEGEHVTVIKARDAACLFAADTQDDVDAACPDGTTLKLRKGVTTVILAQDYVRVRGHEDTLGGGTKAQAVACDLVKQPK